MHADGGESPEETNNCQSPLPRKLTENDHPNIVEALKSLSNTDLMSLGTALGLLYATVRKMDNKLDEMVDAWINERDNVPNTSSPPTWAGLVKALRKIGHNGVANRIVEELKTEMTCS